MQTCPFCLQQWRQLGGIALMSPGMVDGSNQGMPLMGECCVDCMGLISIVLDGLKGGRIKALVERLQLSGALRRS